MKDEKKKVIVCRCEDVSLEEIEKLIDEGCTELEEIKRLLRCGMGPCQGRTCTRLIARLVSRKTGISMSEIGFPKNRPPIRPVPLVLFSKQASEKRKSK